MGGKDGVGRSIAASDAAKQSEQVTEKKKGFVDWINIIKPVNEEKDHWASFLSLLYLKIFSYLLMQEHETLFFCLICTLHTIC